MPRSVIVRNHPRFLEYQVRGTLQEIDLHHAVIGEYVDDPGRYKAGTADSLESAKVPSRLSAIISTHDRARGSLAMTLDRETLFERRAALLEAVAADESYALVGDRVETSEIAFSPAST